MADVKAIDQLLADTLIGSCSCSPHSQTRAILAYTRRLEEALQEIAADDNDEFWDDGHIARKLGQAAKAALVFDPLSTPPAR